MPKYQNVEYTKPFELLLLIVSTIAVFSGFISVLNKIMSFGLLNVILAIVSAAIYFYILKKKFIVKISDFELKSNQLEWKNNIVDFRDLEYYKIHWMIGAEIRFKLKNGKTVHLSSNNHFCNSDKFVKLSYHIDSKLSKYNNGKIERKESFLESKPGYYFAVLMPFLLVSGIIYKLFSDEKLNFENLTLILVSLSIVLSGVKWKRN